MPKSGNQKIKLLKLYEILSQETDEDHPLTTSQLCSRLIALDITCDRRTLTNDIATLNKQGLEIMIMQRGHEKAYYVEDRSFSIPEIKILIDAVQAASFITERKSAEMIGKLAALGGTHRGEILKKNLIRFNTKKHTNESIYYNVDAIVTALMQGKMVSFKYFDLDINANRAYRKDGMRYVVEPIILVFRDDNYYLTAYSSKYNDITRYRVDRMDSVNIEDEPISKRAREEQKRAPKFIESDFKMYGGEHHNITLRFKKKLLGAVFDQFGENTKITEMKDGETYCASVSIQESPTFWGWLFQFGSDMVICSPGFLHDKYLSILKTTLDSLSEQ